LGKAFLDLLFHSYHSILLISQSTNMDSTAQHPRARISAMVRQAYREEARLNGNDNHLVDSAWSKWQSTNTRFYLGAQSAEDLEWDMHDLWYLYYEAASAYLSLPNRIT
jgi:hypothetical protein